MSYLHCGQLSQVLALQIKQRIGQSKQKERAVCWISKLLENMLRCTIRNMALLFWLHDWFWDFFKDRLLYLFLFTVASLCLVFFKYCFDQQKEQERNCIFSEILSINTVRNRQSFSLSMMLSIEKICYVQAQEVCVTNHMQTTDVKSTLRWYSKGRVRTE